MCHESLGPVLVLNASHRTVGSRSGTMSSITTPVIPPHTCDTHPWTGKAARAVDSPDSEVPTAAAERAVGRCGALSRSASAIRVPGCMAGHEIGPGTRRSGPATRRSGAGPRRSGPTTRRSGAGLARGRYVRSGTDRRVPDDRVAGGDRPGESRNRRPDPGPGSFAQALQLAAPSRWVVDDQCRSGLCGCR